MASTNSTMVGAAAPTDFVGNTGDSECCGCIPAVSSNKKAFSGMVKERSTTDVLFLVGIWSMWIVMSIIGGRAVESGHMYKLIAPSDITGATCGYSEGYKDLKYLYTISTGGLGTCVEECPTENADVSMTSTDTDDYICYGNDPSMFSATNCFTDGLYDPTTTEAAAPYSCYCNLKINSVKILRRCVFSEASIRNQYDNQDSPAVTSYFAQFMADVMEIKELIFGYGFCCALILSFLFSHLLKYRSMATLTVVFCILSILFSMMALVGLAQNTRMEWETEDPLRHDDSSIVALNAFSIIMIIIAGLFMCTVIAMRESISVAIECLTLTSMCIEEMWMIVFTPLVQIIGMVLFFIPFVFYIFSIASEGEYVATEPFGRKYEFTNPDTTSELLWFMFFCLLWTGNFIVSVGSIMVAISTATWYFTEPSKRAQEISNGTMFSAYYSTLRYHAGTAAFGGLIIAFVQFFRTIVMYISRKLQQGAKADGAGCTKSTIEYLTCCLQCCLQCAESCLKFMSKNAYIQTAIKGSSFCFGCKDAFFVIARNIGRVGAVNIVQGYALLVLKLFVTLISGGSFYYIINNYYAAELNDLVAPTVFVMIIAWLTSSMFTDVYDTSMDSMLMCFITDEEAHGTPKFASAEFSKFIDNYGKLEVEMTAAKGNNTK